MTNAKRYIFILLACGVLQSVASEKNGKQKVDIDFQTLNDSSVAEKLLGRIDIAVDMLNGKEEINILKISSLMPSLKARVKMHLYEKNRTKSFKEASLSARREVAEDILGSDRYQRLEKACLDNLKSSNTDLRIECIKMLTQGLGSEKPLNDLNAELKNALEMISEGKANPLTPLELFAVAEGLAYLKDPSGSEILYSVLRTEDSPVILKLRAIEAIGYANASLNDRIKTGLFLSKNAHVAYKAFDAFAENFGEPVNFEAAIKQLDRLHEDCQDDGELSRDQRGLLLHLSVELRLSIRKNNLSPKQVQALKGKVKQILETNDPVVQEEIVGLFADLAGDEDIDLIRRLLASDSPDVSSIAALALAHCSKETIKQQADILFGMLESESRKVRNYALFALQVGIGMPAVTYPSEEQFKQNRAIVLKKYKRETSKR